MTARGYQQRAATYPAEIAGVAPPRLLGGLLHSGTTVAEIPSGTGHFLRVYAAADARVVLVDASRAMLAAARPVAAGQSLRTVCARIEDLPAEQVGPVDVVVMPNAALNQLAADADLGRVLAAAASVLPAGGLLLAQVLLVDGDRVSGGCGFYDPDLPDGQWKPDRRLRDAEGRELVRLRRQHHQGDRVLIDFSLTRGDEHLYDHQVALRLFTAEELHDALTAAGFQVAHRLPADNGAQRSAEVLARLPATRIPWRTRTVAEAGEYWDRYYNDEFVTGLGTETIVAALHTLPPVGTWMDAGAGSESLLWSIPLAAEHLIAVDLDTDRLARLRAYAAARRPRPAYRTVLEMCGRTEHDFTARCRSLAATLRADCLTGRPLPIAEGSVELVTQFGLLGLAATPEAFLAAWETVHAPLQLGGWCAGANWVSTSAADRVELTEELYRQAFQACGITPHLLTCEPIIADPDFCAVWIYTGRTA